MMIILKQIPMKRRQHRTNGQFAKKHEALHNALREVANRASYIAAIGFFVAPAYLAYQVANTDTTMISPVSANSDMAATLREYHATPTPTPQPTVVTQPNAERPKAPAVGGGDYDPHYIAGLIEETFGTYADTAFLLLMGGDGVACTENASLNPNAVNHNSDKAQSTDYGVFQINDHWQGFRHDGKAEQFLLDPEINVKVAWRIFEDNGYSFSAWTCGRARGI